MQPLNRYKGTQMNLLIVCVLYFDDGPMWKVTTIKRNAPIYINTEKALSGLSQVLYNHHRLQLITISKNQHGMHLSI